MNAILILFLSLAGCLGQWTMTTWDAYSGHYQQTSNRIIPNKSRLAYACFLTRSATNLDEMMLCDLQCHGAVFGFRGQDVWNTGPAPASVRFYFTSTTNIYSNINSSQHPNDYWWSLNYASLNNPTNFLATLSPEQWGNGGGQQDTNGFWLCVSNVQQFGFAFGGGSFWDVGVSVRAGGEAKIIQDGFP